MKRYSANSLLLNALRRMRRAVSLVACVAVLGWTLLSATHLHDHEAGAGNDRGADCALCLAMPAGAAPPADLVLSVAPPPTATVAAFQRIPAAAAGSVASYLSRGPPAV